MNLTVVVTSNVEDRYRGFLSSLMMEISVGVFTSPRLSAGTRDHIWSVLS
ncbi:CRISPR-associated protein, Cas2, partial [mine drainage metagenome]